MYVTDLTWIKFSLNVAQPVTFMKVTPDSAERLRSSLKMSQDSLEYFDPGSQGECFDWVISLASVLSFSVCVCLCVCVCVCVCVTVFIKEISLTRHCEETYFV